MKKWYKVVSNSNLLALEELVDDLMLGDCGGDWRPVGGLCWDGKLFHQAMMWREYQYD